MPAVFSKELRCSCAGAGGKAPGLAPTESTGRAAAAAHYPLNQEGAPVLEGMSTE
eukprot:SAG11_NODE_15660_length_570_cov_1.176221_1_plen_54_part_10